MREQLPVVGWNRKEEGGLQALDLRVDIGRGRRPRPENRRRADGEWERERVAEAVGEEELSHRKRSVRSGHAQDSLRIAGDGVDDVVMKVHGTLWETGGTRGIEPEGGIILTGVLHLE